MSNIALVRTSIKYRISITLCTVRHVASTIFHQIHLVSSRARALSSIPSVRPSIMLRGIKLTPKPQYATRDHRNESGSQVLALATGNARNRDLAPRMYVEFRLRLLLSYSHQFLQLILGSLLQKNVSIIYSLQGI